MTAYLADLWTALTALLPVLLALAGLTLVALVLDSCSTEDKW
jgi:hypothetical protein